MQAFSGIRVLDFTHVYAGPFTSYQLAVMGAEVIKIEPPDAADMMRQVGVDEAGNQQGLGSCYVCNNQGKRAISLNLASDQGREIAIALVKSADVLVENYSSGLVDFGLGAEQAMAVNPGLIYCELSGFGRDNAFSGRPAYDAVIQAFSGMMSLNGDAGQPFLRVGPPLVDYGTGAQAAFAIASALYQRERSGKGQLIEVNMLDAALMMMSPLVANAIAAGHTDERGGNQQNGLPGYATFACSEGDLMLGAFHPTQHRKLFEALDLVEAMQVPDPVDPGWLQDNVAELRAAISQQLLQRSASYWEDWLNRYDVPAARVRDLYEMLSSDQPRRAAHSRHQRYQGSRMSAPIAAFRYAEDGPRLDKRCARHGEDSDAILTELGYSAAQLEAFREEGVI